jgi:hypothetical protein
VIYRINRQCGLTLPQVLLPSTFRCRNLPKGRE